MRIPVESGDVIRPPRARAWLAVAIGLLAAASTLGAAALIAAARADDPPPAAELVCLSGFGGLGLLTGLPVAAFGWWQLRRRPRWVLGADRMQYVVGAADVRVEIRYENLAAADL